MAPADNKPGVRFWLLQKVLLRFFRTFYLLEVKGLEHVPADGPVIIAANHVNPLDAVIIGVSLRRRIRFVVWNQTFSLPVIGTLLRATGCIPIDREKPDLAAFKESLRWLGGGNILGIFPEGRYTLDGHLNEVKPGTARIALAAKATVVPATLTGAYRAWRFRGAAARMFPHPWKITLKFHPPIKHLEQTGAIRDQKSAAENLTAKIVNSINATLEPAIRAEGKLDRLAAQPASHIRVYEWFLCVVLLVTQHRAGIAVALVYLAYLSVDIFLIRQSHVTRVLRNFSPVVALLAAYPGLMWLIGPLENAGPHRGEIFQNILKQVPQPLTWLVVDWWFFCYLFVIPYSVWAMITYCFGQYLEFQRFIRGFLVTLYFCLLELILIPAMRQEYPLAVTPEQRGFYVRFIEWISPLAAAKPLLLPTLVVSLSIFTLAFDFAHNRRRFYAGWFFIINAWLAALVLRGYPLAHVAVNGATVAFVYAYMHLFKFRAHDGRRI